MDRPQIRTAITLLAALTILTGVIYPLVVTFVGQTLFSHQADGSLLVRDGRVIGSSLLAQASAGERYFEPRPSATSYSAYPSSGSNMGPTSLALGAAAEERRQQFLKRNRLSVSTLVPQEMLFASASGLDPHISPEAALLQIGRIAKARGLAGREAEIERLVRGHVEHPTAGFLGEPRVNVLELNCALDALR
jgi:K+-transporting ATPase ATPase C chain